MTDNKNMKEDNGPVTYPVINKFPMSKWMEWEKDCKENYNDCRWFKMWSEHNAVKSDSKYSSIYDNIKKLEERILFLETKFNELQENKNKKKNILGEDLGE